MVSFFEKLKKGMGIEMPEKRAKKKVEKIEEKPVRREKVPKTQKEGKPADGQAKKIKTEEKPVEMEVEKLELVKPEIKKGEIKEGKIETTPVKKEEPVLEEKKIVEDKEKWFEAKGELAIDVYQTEKDLIIQSTIAGMKPEDLDITMEKDIITIQGNRQKPFEEQRDYFIQECYWGPFSREVILPVEVDPDRVEAVMKEGILTIRIPKALREKKRRIKVRI